MYEYYCCRIYIKYYYSTKYAFYSLIFYLSLSPSLSVSLSLYRHRDRDTLSLHKSVVPKIVQSCHVPSLLLLTYLVLKYYLSTGLAVPLEKSLNACQFKRKSRHTTLKAPIKSPALASTVESKTRLRRRSFCYPFRNGQGDGWRPITLRVPHYRMGCDGMRSCCHHCWVLTDSSSPWMPHPPSNTIGGCM